MSKKQSSLKKNSKVISLFILFIVVAAAVVSYYVYTLHNTEQRIRETIEDEYKLRHVAISSEISTYIESEMQRVYGQLGILSLSENITTGSTEVCNSYVRNAIKSSYLVIGSISRTGPAMLFDCSTSDTTIGLDGRNYPYIVQLFEDQEHKPVVAAPFISQTTRAAGTYVTAIHVPVRRDGEFVGTLGSAVFLEELLETAVEKAIPPDEDDFLITLLDDKGLVVAHNKGNFIGENVYEGALGDQLRQSDALEPYIEQRVSFPDELVYEFTLEGEKRIGGVTTITLPDGDTWHVSVVRSLIHTDSAVIPLLTSARQDGIIFAVVVLGMVASLFILLSKWNSVLQQRIFRATVELREQIDRTKEYQKAAEEQRDQAQTAEQHAEQQRKDADAQRQEAEQVNQAMVGREMKMIELKSENEALRKKLAALEDNSHDT